MSMNEVRTLNIEVHQVGNHMRKLSNGQKYSLSIEVLLVNKFKMFAFHLIRSEQCSGYTCVKNSDLEFGQSNGVTISAFHVNNYN